MSQYGEGLPMIGVRLKLARRAAGLSLRALATAINHRVTAQAIGKYERNEGMPRSGVLIALADAPAHVGRLSARRSRPGPRGPRVQEERLHDQARRSAGRSPPCWRTLNAISPSRRSCDFPAPIGTGRATRPIPYSAIPSKPTAPPPRSATIGVSATSPYPTSSNSLEERGIKIFAVPLGSVGGLAARAGRPRLPPVPLVVVNAKDWGESQRFTIAHELGHILLAVARGLNAERGRTHASRGAPSSCPPRRCGSKSASTAAPSPSANYSH